MNVLVFSTLALVLSGGAEIARDPQLCDELEKAANDCSFELQDPACPYEEIEKQHRLTGRACYYSGFFEGRKTANGEIFRHGKFTAAHLTLPLGTWIDVRSVQTGKIIRVKVNDRGPYSGGFVLDLSQSAAHALGVDRARDRRVQIHIVALPGETPPAELTSDWGDVPEPRHEKQPEDFETAARRSVPPAPHSW